MTPDRIPAIAPRGEHTPGPWRAERYIGREDNWFIRGPNDERVCGQGSGRVVEANARLIAAAPELLEVLVEASEFIQPFNRAEALLAKIDAAIAKAVQS